MKNENNSKSNVSRRKFLGGAAAVTALSMAPLNYAFKPDPLPANDLKAGSDFGGVQLGAITYSWRSMPGGVENIIKYCLETGITTIELMSGDVEEYLGSPVNPMMAIFASMKPPTGTPPPGGFQRPKLTAEQEAAVAKYKEDVKAWRLALPISKYEAVRKLFNDAGISIHIIKFSPAKWSDGEIDYAFNAAKALGAKGVSEEIGEDAVKKLGPIAEKHGLYAIFHQHMQFATAGFSYEPFLVVSPAVMINFDAGHFFGSTGIHPNTIIEKYNDRIVSIHIKDKSGPKTDPANTNQVWGQGEMPLAEVLLLIKKNKWPIFCDVELEYDVKPWSNAVKEVKTCVNYARQILS
jgi:sugar phosphate isomerase/epimerase